MNTNYNLQSGQSGRGWSKSGRDRIIAMTALLAGIFIGAGFSGGQNSVCGQDSPVASLTEPVDAAQLFLRKHCVECHSDENPEGELSITSLSRDFARKDNRRTWGNVLEQVKTGNMPPAEKPRPAAKDVTTLVDWINVRVTQAEIKERTLQGRVVLRRLNRNEYVNTVRDLLGVHVDLKDLLPPITSSSRFDNNAEALHVSTYLMENYLAAADRLLDAAIANGPRPHTVKQRHDIKDEKTVAATGSVYRYTDDGVAIFSSSVAANIQVTMWRFMSRHPGRYRFRISGYGIQTEDPVMFHVKAGPMNAAAQQYLIDYFEIPPKEPTVIEFVDQMKARQTIRIVADLKTRTREVEKIGADKYTGPGMVVQWVDVEGPLLDSWPPKSHRQIFGDMKRDRDPEDRNRWEVVSEQPLFDARRILTNFARRAFRRSVTDDDIQQFLDRFQVKLDQGYSFEQALRVGLKAVMVSPHFLFLRERTGSSDQQQPLDDFALASRLSYFLWSSMPDEQLLELAGQRKLRNPDALRTQVERMLSDPKADAFTRNFASQWLGLRSIDDTMPDRLLYPEYDDILKISMVKETLLFFDEVLKNDLSLTNFIASDFTMLNGRLSRHYKIAGVKGLGFKKVSLPPNSHRGGVLTMASVLKVTANGTTTSPVLRGAWVLDRMLGTPPPKPTVDVEAIEPDIRGSTTIRQQLSKHRDLPACAVCHIMIDPPGFALENFDVIGGWREHYRSVDKGTPVTVDGHRMRYRNGPVVDASDVLPDDRSFRNIDEFKQLLLEDKDLLARALAKKLVEYATGAATTAADQSEIENIVDQIRDRNFGLRSLVHEVVQSTLFRHK